MVKEMYAIAVAVAMCPERSCLRVWSDNQAAIYAFAKQFSMNPESYHILAFVRKECVKR